MSRKDPPAPVTDLATIRAELDPEQAETSAAVAWIRDVFQIVDDATFATAGEMLTQAKGRWKILEDKRTSLTKPLLAVKRGIDDLFSPVLGSLAQTEQILKQKIGAFTAAREEQRRALMRSSAAEHQAGGTPIMVIPEPAKVQGVSVQVFWNFRITDPDQVPRDLCSPDQAKIGRAVWYANTETPPRPISGVEFFLDQQVSARAAK